MEECLQVQECGGFSAEENALFSTSCKPFEKGKTLGSLRLEYTNSHFNQAVFLD
jgi:hypothetical protein